MEPEELARQLGISPKTLRAWLRRHFPRASVDRGARWGDLLPDQEAAARARFGGMLHATKNYPIGPMPEAPAHHGGTLAARRTAAERYRPESIELLLVGEAPPRAEDRYFYFERVSEHDSLFRYVVHGLFGEFPDRGAKEGWLERLQQAGVFLVDAAEEPAGADALASHVSKLVERCRSLQPAHVILIKTTVYDAAFVPLRRAGLPVVDKRIPFPGSGQQTRFMVAFREALTEAGYSDGS